MPTYTVTATLVKASLTDTTNGVTKLFSVDIPITAIETADTLTAAKQNARQKVNRQSFILLHQQLAAYTLQNSDYFGKGRLSSNIATWQSVNITDIRINP
jgi:hypothetical protein